MTKLVKLYRDQHSSKRKAREEHGTAAALVEACSKPHEAAALSHPAAGKALGRGLLLPLGE